MTSYRLFDQKGTKILQAQRLSPTYQEGGRLRKGKLDEGNGKLHKGREKNLFIVFREEACASGLKKEK